MNSDVVIPYIYYKIAMNPVLNSLNKLLETCVSYSIKD